MSLYIGIDPGPKLCYAVQIRTCGAVIGPTTGLFIPEPYDLTAADAGNWGDFAGGVVCIETAVLYQGATADTVETLLNAGGIRQEARWEHCRVVELTPVQVRKTVVGKAACKRTQVKAAMFDLWKTNGKDYAGRKCKKCHGKGWLGRDHERCPDCLDGWGVYPSELADMRGKPDHYWSALAVAVAAANIDAETGT